MRSIFFFICCVLITNLYSQDCTEFYPVKAGANWETQNYDAKDKLQGIAVSKILAYNATANGYQIEIETENFDGKSKPISKSKYQMSCADGIFLFDMSSFIDPTTMESYKEMEVAMDTKNMEYPSVLSAGMSLNDASLTMTVSNQGIKMMTLTIFITNRKVESYEDITVPAGTFKAYKISNDSETKMMFKVKTHTVQYWVPGKGVVRTENYNDKGKLTDYSVMSKIEI